MTRDACDVKFEIDDWMLVKAKIPDLHYMCHRCMPEVDMYRSALYCDAKFPQRARHPAPRWRCGWCLDLPPEELEALYLMLESEHAYAVMEQYTR